MGFDMWLAYLALIGVVVIAPGPSVLLCASHGIAYGLPRTFGTIAGDQSANVLQMTIAALGLGVALFASPKMFAALKWAGVIFLVHRGVQNWKGKVSPTSRSSPSTKSTKSL